MSKTKQKTTPNEVMVVNDSPGEECRIAILEDGHLEELFTERTTTATNSRSRRDSGPRPNMSSRYMAA